MAEVAIIGAGLIGRAWAIVHARGGSAVRLFDTMPGAAAEARDFAAARLPELAEAGLLREPAEAILARIALAPSLEASLAGAAAVQENGPEVVEVKRVMFAELDRLASPGALLMSSTSGIPASAFTADLAGRGRCLVAHPMNPPYLAPIVELAPAPWTAPEAVARARALMSAVGQTPVLVRREAKGFILNRLQAGLLAEAFRLVAEGIASPADVDAVMTEGLGLRWSFMGPFETIDLNAPGGIADYCRRYGGLYAALQEEMRPMAWDEGLIGRLEAERRAALPLSEQPGRQNWRDRRLMALLAHKAAQT